MFATRWLPYGGGPTSEIWLSFGLADETYFRRLWAILTDSERLFEFDVEVELELDRNKVAALLEQCRRRSQSVRVREGEVHEHFDR